MQKSGFTLLELSIVLVIIGLIIGGVTAGSELINQAALRAVSRDITTIETALSTYKLKYNAVPGDMRNATAYWGVAALDGNGDSIVFWDGAAQDYDEAYQVWKHLNLSNIFANSMTGTHTGTNGVVGVNTLPSSIDGAGWSVFTERTTAYGYGQTDTKRRLTIGLGGENGGIANGSVLEVEDMKALDDKSDDGKPATGRYIHMRSLDGDCVDNTTIAANYNVAQTGKQCHIYYLVEDPVR
jgi:prepilin-type N-terminal cleavage/methylation domain-containing protein